MNATPCIPADLDPRPVHDIVARFGREPFPFLVTARDHHLDLKPATAEWQSLNAHRRINGTTRQSMAPTTLPPTRHPLHRPPHVPLVHVSKPPHLPISQSSPMSSPTLTFTPAMFHASQSGAKDTTRRLAQVSRQNDIDQLAAHIADDNELAFWQGHTHLCAHQPGETKPMVTNWSVAKALHAHKPTQLTEQVLAHGGVPKGIWFDNGTEKPAWTGKLRPGRFLPKSLYHLAPQVEILTVHPEFLHDITEASALREGISQITKDQQDRKPEPLWKYGLADTDGLPGTDNFGWPWNQWCLTARDAYFKLWDTINAEKDNGQHAAANNPVVWVITYRLLSTKH